MSSRQAEPSRRRGAAALPSVAVVEAGSVPGSRVTAALVRAAEAAGNTAPVVAVDARPATLTEAIVPEASWRQADPATPAVLDALRGVDAVVWVAASADLQAALAQRASARRARMVRTAQTLVTAAAAAGAHRLVVVTSAKVYGARADNAVPLPEEAPLRATPDDGVVGDLLAVEQILATARSVHPGLAVTVVRPAALVGPGVDTVVTRHFEAPRLLTVKGAHPAWQFCHVEDLAAALVVVLRRDPTPVVTVGCDGWLAQSQLETLTGMRHVELSPAAALGTAQRLHRVGVLPAPASELALALYPWAVDSATLRTAGWEPAYDNETCVGVLLESIRGRHAVGGRRVNPRDAALGAASAAVALVGTAAAVRRARKR